MKSRILWCLLFALCMAALLSSGATRDFALCNMLVAMGAEIEGSGTSNLTIHGVKRLHGAT